MCATDEKSYELAYKAARNALESGEDFSNGGCFLDGYGCTEAAKSLGIHQALLSRWIKEHQEPDGQAFKGNGKSAIILRFPII